MPTETAKPPKHQANEGAIKLLQDDLEGRAQSLYKCVELCEDYAAEPTERALNVITAAYQGTVIQVQRYKHPGVPALLDYRETFAGAKRYTDKRALLADLHAALDGCEVTLSEVLDTALDGAESAYGAEGDDPLPINKLRDTFNDALKRWRESHTAGRNDGP